MGQDFLDIQYVHRGAKDIILYLFETIYNFKEQSIYNPRYLRHLFVLKLDGTVCPGSSDPI